MKLSLRVLGTLLAGLLTVAMIGCGSDDEDIIKNEEETLTPEEKLVGEYELIERETDHEEDEWDGVSKPPDFEATMMLTDGGDAVEFGVFYGSEFSNHNTWSATATTITFTDADEEITASYTLQGTTLTIIYEFDFQTVTEKWKKKQ